MAFSKEARKSKLLHSGFVIRKGSLADWKKLSHLHYRPDRLGAVDSFYCLEVSGKLAGAVVYTYPIMQLSARHRLFAGRYTGTIATREKLILLNREVRTLRRIAISPSYRNRGLATRLVRETALLPGVPFMECITSRRAGFLEAAGFSLVGTTGPKRSFYYILDTRRNKNGD